MNKDLLTGALLSLTGTVIAVYYWKELPLGSPSQMGPGFFPLGLSLVLVAIGLGISVSSMRVAGGTIGKVSARGPLLITAAVVFFAFAIRRMGLVPTTLITCLCVCFADRRITPIRALGISAFLTAFCVLVFHYGLDLPTPLVSVNILSWFGR